MADVEGQDPIVHARPTRHAVRQARAPRAARPVGERRRLASAVLSSLLPGLGQALNGHRRLASLFFVPIAILALVALLAWRLIPSMALVADLITPGALSAILVLNGALLIWRLIAVAQAFFDPRYRAGMNRVGVLVLVLVVLFTVAPHLLVNQDALAAKSAFAQIFAGGQANAGGAAESPTAIPPAPNERINVLLMGIDAAPGRTEALTDSLMVVSMDPVGRTVSILSLPRDLIGVPLGNGNVFGPKLNSLRSFAYRNPKQFPQGGTRALEDAVGALLGIRINYEATVNLIGFIKVVDAVGGVDVTNTTNLNDAKYDWLDGTYGFILPPGQYHLDGRHALAYARSRYTPGDTDFGRAERQQEVLLAIRSRVLQGNVILRLPQLLDALTGLIATDIPYDRLPDFAALASQVGPGRITRVVIDHPLVRGEMTKYGSSQIPNLLAIRAMAAGLFSPPGTVPTPYPSSTQAP